MNDMAEPITCDVIREIGPLTSLSDSWRELLRDAANPEPVHTPSWLLTWWEVFGNQDGRELRVMTFRDRDARLVGLLPLLSRTLVSKRRPIPIRRLELLASGEDELHEICSEYIGAIVRRGWEGPVALEAANLLCTNRVGRWDELSMCNMRADDPFVPAFQHALSNRGASVDVSHTNVAFYVDLPTSWEHYLRDLTSSHRYAVRRAVKDFDGWRNGREQQLRCATGGPDLREGFDVLRRLHGERWGSGRGAFRSALFTSFHEKLCERMARSGDAQVELLWLLVGGEPTSALYNFVLDGRVRYYQAGRKTELPKQVRPGIVIHTFALQRAIEMGRHEYDFLATHRQYKAQLASRRRTLVTLRGVAPSRSAERRIRSLRWLDRTESHLRDLSNVARRAVARKKAVSP